MARILVVANETLGGAKLIETVRARHAKGDADFALVVPQNRPSHGQIIYDEAVRDAAQVRVDLAQQFLGAQGIDIFGEVGDEDPFQATMDAIADFQPDEIIVSTHPVTQSGWLRRDLVERIREASGLPVEHVVVDLAQEGLPFTVTLVVANRTAGGQELLEKLKAAGVEAKAAASTAREIKTITQANKGQSAGDQCVERGLRHFAVDHRGQGRRPQQAGHNETIRQALDG